MSEEQISTAEEIAGWGATRADVVRQLRTCLAEDMPAATAVVTDVEGSAYRRPGARLVVTEKSAMGAITAGCLEGPVADRARSAMTDGVPSTETYDLTETDSDAWGLGLGCNGVIDVLVDPVDASLRPALDAMARNERAVVATVLAVGDRSATEVAPGDRTTVLGDGSTADAEHLQGTGRRALPDDLLDAISAEAEGTLDTVDAEADEGLAAEHEAGNTASLSSLTTSTTESVEFLGTDIAVFCDVYEPIPTLLVFGSQGDVRPVTRFARETGFRVHVVTGRGAKAEAERFPAADSVQGVRAPNVADLVEAPGHTYAVVMSHNFLDDRLAVESLLNTPVPYIGLMGPSERFEEMRESFAEEGRTLTAAELARISTPVGLDLGGDQPARIGMSVVAEVLAVHNDRPGGRLATRDRPVHDR